MKTTAERGSTSYTREKLSRWGRSRALAELGSRAPGAMGSSAHVEFFEGARTMSLLTQCICVACQLGIPDFLEEEPRAAAEVAVFAEASEEHVLCLLRFLEAGGCLSRQGDNWALTERGRILTSSHPQSQRPAFMTNLTPSASAELINAMHHKEASAFARATGVEYFEHEDVQKWWHEALKSQVAVLNALILQSYNRWEEVTCLADVGGGAGYFLAEALARYPRMQGKLLDLPAVVARAPEILAAAGVADRCTIIAADARREMPEGADLYLFARFFSTLDDAGSVNSLERLRHVAGPTARVLVVDRFSDGAPPSLAVAAADYVNLLYHQTGRERTVDELAHLFASAGFTVTRAIETPTAWTLVEAVPATT